MDDRYLRRVAARLNRDAAGYGPRIGGDARIAGGSTDAAIEHDRAAGGNRRRHNQPRNRIERRFDGVECVHHAGAALALHAGALPAAVARERGTLRQPCRLRKCARCRLNAGYQLRRSQVRIDRSHQRRDTGDDGRGKTGAEILVDLIGVAVRGRRGQTEIGCRVDGTQARAG